MKTRTMIDLDDEKRAAAARGLGTTNTVETVHGALDEIAKRELRRAFVDDLVSGEIDLSADTMSGCWR